MPKSPNLGEYPKKHRIGSAAEEEADRSIHRADEENWRFYQEAQEAARRVSEIQAGVNESVARAITRGMNRPDEVQEAVKRERVQSELYRNVAGNELYETGGVPDPALRDGTDNKNYLGSENNDYLSSGVGGKIGRQFRRFGQGAISMVGFNNRVEAAVSERFGNNQEIEARRLFVANMLAPLLIDIGNTVPVDLDTISTVLGAPLYGGGPMNDYVNNELVPRMAETNLAQLREMLRTVPQFLNNLIFSDMMMIVDADQRETVKIGIEGVYNPERLRFLRDARLQAGGPQQALMNRVRDIAAENSLFPFDKNPEGMALMAEIEARFNRIVAENVAAMGQPAANNFAAQQILDTLNEIVNNELPVTGTIQNNVNRRNNIQTALNEIVTNRQSLIDSYSNLESMANNIASCQGRLAAAPRDAALNAEMTSLQNARRDLITAMNTAQNSLQLQCRNIMRLAGPTVIFTDISNAAKIANAAVLAPLPWTAPPLINILNTRAGEFDNAVNVDIPNVINGIQTNQVARVSPFILLQRFTRRTYCEARNMDPANLQDEEVNRYATLSAKMRVQDAKNADLLRNSNRKAAEFLHEGLAGRGVDKLKSALVKGQNWVGLEPFSLKERTEDVVIKQIINSREEFAPLKGINKFSTTRDIREILNNTSKTVALETLERFIQMLEEAVSEFKKGEVKSKRFGIIPGDWDIENLILVMQKLKSERWTMELMARLQREGAAGNREHAFITLLQEQRAMEQRISAEIRAEVKHPGAMWKKLLVKNELKEVLDAERLDSMTKLRNAGIAAKEADIKRQEQRLAQLPENNPLHAAEREKIQREIQNLRESIAGTRREIADSQDLFDRVEAAKKHIEESDLSRKETKAYVQEIGLTGVWDKMGTNFRLKRYWKKTKKGANWLWGKTKGAWAWSRKKFINAETGRKAASVGSLLATPVTAPVGLAWKVGTFPFRLTGRAMLWSASVPGMMYRSMSDSAMREYLLKKPLDMNAKLRKLADKKSALQAKSAKAPYQRDKLKIAKKIVDVELEAQEIAREWDKLKVEADKRKLPIGPLGSGGKEAAAK